MRKVLRVILTITSILCISFSVYQIINRCDSSAIFLKQYKLFGDSTAYLYLCKNVIRSLFDLLNVINTIVLCLILHIKLSQNETTIAKALICKEKLQQKQQKMFENKEKNKEVKQQKKILKLQQKINKLESDK